MRPSVGLLLLFVAFGSALEIKAKRAASGAEEDDVDRFSHIRVRPRETFVAAGALTVAATAAQVLKPQWVERALGAAGGANAAGRALYSLIKYVDDLKTANPLGLTMGHGLLLKAIAEVLAQVIPQASSPLAWLDPLRIVRSTIASLLSSSLTFYYWTRLSWVRALKAPAWLASVLGQKLGTTITKTFVTQALYRPINVYLFLLGQAFFRGDSARALMHTIRSKFKGGLLGGIAFFTVSNLIMFSIPVPFLHPIIGAIAGLIFNVWLAMVAYQKDAPAAATPPPPLEPATGLVPLAAFRDAVGESPVAAFPATASLLGMVGVLEGLAAASIYARTPTMSVKTTNTDVQPTPNTPDVLGETVVAHA